MICLTIFLVKFLWLFGLNTSKDNLQGPSWLHFVFEIIFRNKCQQRCLDVSLLNMSVNSVLALQNIVLSVCNRSFGNTPFSCWVLEKISISIYLETCYLSLIFQTHSTLCATITCAAANQRHGIDWFFVNNLMDDWSEYLNW